MDRQKISALALALIVGAAVPAHSSSAGALHNHQFGDKATATTDPVTPSAVGRVWQQRSTGYIRALSAMSSGSHVDWSDTYSSVV